MNASIDVTGRELSTERLILRPFSVGDLLDFNEYARAPGVGDLAGWLPHRSVEESKEILDLFIAEKKTFAVVLKETCRVIGSVGIEPYNEALVGQAYADKSCRELGYVLSRDYWGRGLMPEAASRVLTYCFDELSLDAVFCLYFKRNQRSRRVSEKLGFEFLCDCAVKNAQGIEEPSVMTVMHRENRGK